MDSDLQLLLKPVRTWRELHTLLASHPCGWRLGSLDLNKTEYRILGRVKLKDRTGSVIWVGKPKDFKQVKEIVVYPTWQAVPESLKLKLLPMSPAMVKALLQHPRHRRGLPKEAVGTVTSKLFLPGRRYANMPSAT